MIHYSNENIGEVINQLLQAGFGKDLCDFLLAYESQRKLIAEIVSELASNIDTNYPESNFSAWYKKCLIGVEALPNGSYRRFAFETQSGIVYRFWEAGLAEKWGVSNERYAYSDGGVVKPAIASSTQNGILDFITKK